MGRQDLGLQTSGVGMTRSPGTESEEASLGFGGTDTSLRVTTREYDPSTGLCALVVEEE